MKNLLYMLLFSLTLPFSTIAQNNLKQQIPTDPAVRMGQLENGIKYYLRQNNKPENRVELRLAVNAGSMQEDDDQQGLAHFVEHMAFNGSTNFKKNELVDYLESIGMKFGPDLNAYTSFDETVYMLQVRTDSADMLQKGLLVLQDWASGLTFNPEEIDKERGVVESERRSSLSPDQRMFNQYLPVLYKGSRYAERLPIGKSEVVEKADYETIERFYKEWYRPDLMAVVAVGDIDLDAMENEIKQRFGNIAPVENPREKIAYPVPINKETLVSIISDKEASFTRVQLKYKHEHQKDTTLESVRTGLMHSLYNSMLSSRLQELTTQADPPFTVGYSGYGRDLGNTDVYEGYAFVGEGGALRGLKTLLVENERVRKHGFLPSELERQKTELMRGMKRSVKEKDKTNSNRFASQYVRAYLKKNPIPSIEQRLELYEQFLPTIQLEEINALADQWITDENRVVIITAPEKDDVKLPTEKEVLQVLEDAKSVKVDPYTDETSDAPLLKEKLSPVKIVEESYVPNIDVTDFKLENGIRIILKPTDFKNDEIVMESFSRGGHSRYDDEDYLSASVATRIVQEAGLGEFSNTVLEKKLTGKTVRVYPYIGNLYEGIGGSCSPDDLETMLQLTYLYFTAPREDEETVQSFVNKQKSIFKNLMSNPDYYFSDQTQRIKYTNRLRHSWPSEEELDKINLEKVMEVYRDRFADASDFTFIFVGNFEVDAMKKMLATYLGNLPTEQREDEWRDLNDDLVKGNIQKQFTKGQAQKALVEITYHGDRSTWTRKDLLHFYSLMSLLRIKLRESMREDKGGVYGVNISGVTQMEPDPYYSIIISFNAAPDKVEELIATAMMDLDTAQQVGILEKDLTKVRESFIQDRVRDLKENRWWSGFMYNFYRQGWDDFDYFELDTFTDIMNRISPEDLQKAAQFYFSDKANRIEVVMKPEGSK